MFNFGAYRGFLMLTAFDLCLGACGFILTLAGTAIDFVVDRLTGFVLLQCFGSFLRSEIAAVPIDFFLVSGKKFRGHRNIMLVGSCHFYRMNQTALHQKFYYLRKQLLLDSVSHQDVAKSPQRIAIRHLIAGFYSAKVRKGTAVDYLGNRCHI